MTRPQLLGEIAEKDGMICLQTAPNLWYPLGGNSGIAEKFRESFGEPQRSDLGRRLYDSAGVLQMENMEQREARLARDAHNPDTNPHWTPKLGYRVYACAECGTETNISTNHTGTVWAHNCAGTCRDISNPHTSREAVQWHPPRRHNYVREVEA